MNQEKIAKFIKEIRLKDNLSQEKFGEKYGVSYQAVSKWENAKNIPDISILKEICNDYNIDINELLNDKKIVNNKKYLLFLVVIIILVISLIVTLIIFVPKTFHQNKSFNFKTIKTTCEEFELSGSMAYDSNRTSIYISNISYCDKNNQEKYKMIECIFYEMDNNIKKEIDSYKYDEEEIGLEDFLKNVKFNVDHYSKTCKMYKDNSLVLEIKATDKNNKTTFYSIPIKLEDNCK